MENVTARCILAARERQLMASSRGNHGCCSNCMEPKGISDRTGFSSKSWQRMYPRPAISSYRQLALGEEAIHVVEREVGDVRVHCEVAAETHLGPIEADRVNRQREHQTENPESSESECGGACGHPVPWR